MRKKVIVLGGIAIVQNVLEEEYDLIGGSKKVARRVGGRRTSLIWAAKGKMARPEENAEGYTESQALVQNKVEQRRENEETRLREKLRGDQFQQELASQIAPYFACFAEEYQSRSILQR